jgi:Permuted papain-like amidase enzyme, YaeF/YiiX, C92 family
VMIKEGQALLKEGDLVLRLNTDPGSQYIKNFNRQDKSYSHAGIVIVENGYPYVYHIVNGEENPDEKLRKDSLHRFCNPRRNYGYGIYRYQLATVEMKRLKQLLHQWYKQGIYFDSSFNLKTDNRMYCSEMISKALTRVTRKRIKTATTAPTTAEATFFSAFMRLPFSYTSTLRVVTIDNLYLHPACYMVKRFDYGIY